MENSLLTSAAPPRVGTQWIARPLGDDVIRWVNVFFTYVK